MFLRDHCTLKVVLLAEEGDIVSVREDELEAGLGKEAAQVSTEHSLKEPPQGDHMI